MNKRRAFVLARWMLAVGTGIWTARQLFIAGTADVPMAGVLHGFFGLSGLLATVLLAAPEVVGLAVMPLHRMIDAVLLPSESEPPPADYTLARFYRQHGRYGEACEEYLKIIRYHPKERAAYLEGIETAGQGGQLEVAGKIHRLGQRAFRGAAMLGQLETALDASYLAAAHKAEIAMGTSADEAPAETIEDAPSPEPPDERFPS